MEKVVIYTLPTCPYCQQAKQFLGVMSVPFAEVNVEGNEAKQQEMVAKAGGQQTTPVIVVGEPGNEKVIVGFGEGQKAQLKSMLGLS